MILPAVDPPLPILGRVEHHQRPAVRAGRAMQPGVALDGPGAVGGHVVPVRRAEQVGLVGERPRGQLIQRPHRPLDVGQLGGVKPILGQNAVEQFVQPPQLVLGKRVRLQRFQRATFFGSAGGHASIIMRSAWSPAAMPARAEKPGMPAMRRFQYTSPSFGSRRFPASLRIPLNRMRSMFNHRLLKLEFSARRALGLPRVVSLRPQRQAGWACAAVVSHRPVHSTACWPTISRIVGNAARWPRRSWTWEWPSM